MNRFIHKTHTPQTDEWQNVKSINQEFEKNKKLMSQFMVDAIISMMEG